ncbi:MAG: IPT/TIG domain-containing protein [Terriglobales bacterium]
MKVLRAVIERKGSALTDAPASAVPGHIGGAVAFNGDPNNYLYHEAVSAYPSGTSPVTMEAWFQFASSAGVNEIVGYGNNSATGSRAALYWDGSSGYMEFNNIAVSGPLSFDTNWHHLIGVYGGGTLSTATSQLYLDGNLISNTTSGGTPAITTTELKIGGLPTVQYCCAMNGAVDEVRVSSGTRSADWIATEYANQSSPWSFYTLESSGGLSTPIIASLSPAAGGPGTQVSIQGSNFGSTQGTSTVSFNGVPAASIVSWGSAQVVAVAPSPVLTGPVTVVVNSVPSNGNVVFTANNPLITNLAPPAAQLGSHIVINGYGFGTGGTVSFNGAATNILSWNSTAISVLVPYAATTGPVTVTVNGIVSNGVEFTVAAPPVVSELSPVRGIFGTVVTINGSGFGSLQSNSTVAFNGSAAEVNSWNDSQIVAIVPRTTTGPVTVTVGFSSAQGPTFTVDNVAILTNSRGDQTTYTSTMIGGVWELLSAEGPGCSSCSIRNNQQNTYDSNGNLLTTTDANSNTISYTYDANNNVLSKTAQLNGSPVTTSYTYNSFGEVLTMTDPLGHTTTNTYDSHGNLLSVTSPAPNSQTPASVTQFAYNTLGELTQITDPLGHPTSIQYYPTGLVQSITDAQNNTTSYTYDARGNRISVIDPINGSAHPTNFTYDIMNRLLGITYPNGTSVGFGYDNRGRRISATDQNNKTTTYAYDDADRLLSVTDPLNNLTQFNYDTENNLTGITDANNHTTSFTYDAFGRVEQTAFPSLLLETYGYDQVGNLTSKTDRKGQRIEYIYDSLNRLVNKVYPDSTSANYTYDLVGKIQQVTDPTGQYAFAYDNMGRLIGTITQYSFLPGHNFQNAYTYDTASNRTSMTAPDGSTNYYSYDTLNRLNTLTSTLTGQFGFSYDSLSRRTQLTRPNGVNTTYNYDTVSNLLSVLHRAGSTTVDGAGYGYDYAGNRTSKTNYPNGTTSTYGYDAISELLSVTGGTTEGYSYDAAGNRLSSVTVPSYIYNSSNELTATSNGSYSYDNNGNTLTDASGKSYSWDFENRLVSAVVPGTGTVTFEYDPFGRRIYKSSPNFTGVFAYDDDNLIETMSPSGAVVARYTQTQNIDEPLAELRSSGSSYYEADGLGSTTSLSSPAGSVANTYIYDSFGNVTNLTGTLSNPFRFTGREFDSETGAYYYRARYFNPSAGRFLSEDPIQFLGGANFYSYVHDNPANMTDPLGLCDKKPANSEVPQNPCKYAGRNPDPSAWAAMGQNTMNNPFTTTYDFVKGFAIGGYLDAQPMATGNAYEKAAYGNYVFGAYMSGAGFPLSVTLAGANEIAFYHGLSNSAQYSGRQMDSFFWSLPAANVANITAGYNAQRNGTLCRK